MSAAPSVSERAGYLGGSDAAGILGLSPWTTPYQIFAAKLGIGVPRVYDEETEDRFFMGNLLEHAIAQAFQRKSGRPVVRTQEPFFRHSAFPFMGAHLDFQVFDEPAIVECKNVRFVGEEWGKQDDPDRAPHHCIPIYYLTQIDHYMAVVAAERAYVAALFGGVELRYYCIERSRAREEILIEAEGRFWKRIENDDPPDPLTIDDLMLKLQHDYSGEANRNKRKERERILVPPKLARDLFEELGKARAERKKASKRETAAKEAILALVQKPADFFEEGTGRALGKLLFTVRKSIMTRSLAQTYPEIAASFTHEQVSPRITVEGTSDEDE